MKERLAFFAAAQYKVAPPPPVKPKSAAGGLTWSQPQKLRQEQEAKEAAEKSGRKNPTSVNAFREYVKEGEEIVEIVELRREVEDWVGTFSLPWDEAK